MKTDCGRLRALTSLRRETLTVGWVQLALSNLDFLNGLFLGASRSLSVGYEQGRQQQQFASIAVQYKLMCVKVVIDAISANTEPRMLGDIIVAETLVLAMDEVGDQATSHSPMTIYQELTAREETHGGCRYDKATRGGRC